MLIQTHSGLVYSQLHRFNLIHDQDAESLGYEALYKAIVDYDESRGTALSTLATVYIYNALGSYLRTMNKQRQLQIVSYNNVAYTDDSEEHEFVDMLADELDIERDYVRKEVGRVALEVFDKQYDKLTNEKHRAILSLWRASEFSAQTTDIAEQVGVSQSYVSQIINNFKHVLKKKLEDVYYD